MTFNEAIEKIISVEKAEVGYLEKESNSNLNSKTGNAGDENFTKYWKAIKDWKLGNYQGSYWCAAFQFWCFVTAFGLENAKKLLYHAPFIYCPTIANLFKSKNRLFSNPKVGDIVVFKGATRFNHTGFVYKVDETYFYTIEGNTSGGSAVVRNGGSVAKKKYSIVSAKAKGHKFCRVDYSIVATEKDTKIDSVREVQEWLNKNYNAKLTVDNDYGKKTKTALVKALQKELNESYVKGKKLVVDGEFGAKTRAAISNFKKGDKNDVIQILQCLFVCAGYKGVFANGVFGEGTHNATIELKKKYKLTPVNGIAGKRVFEKLCK